MASNPDRKWHRDRISDIHAESAPYLIRHPYAAALYLSALGNMDAYGFGSYPKIPKGVFLNLIEGVQLRNPQGGAPFSFEAGWEHYFGQMWTSSHESLRDFIIKNCPARSALQWAPEIHERWADYHQQMPHPYGWLLMYPQRYGRASKRKRALSHRFWVAMWLIAAGATPTETRGWLWYPEDLFHEDFDEMIPDLRADPRFYLHCFHVGIGPVARLFAPEGITDGSFNTALRRIEQDPFHAQDREIRYALEPEYQANPQWIAQFANTATPARANNRYKILPPREWRFADA